MSTSLWTLAWLVAGLGSCLAAITAGVIALRAVLESRPRAAHALRRRPADRRIRTVGLAEPRQSPVITGHKSPPTLY